MGLNLRFKRNASERDEKGIALFMVIGAMSILSILVTEFTYVAQVNSRMAYDGLDQLRAHYLAKTGFKISLLRLKAYQSVKAVAGGSANSPVPKALLDKIWSFPFIYPLPTTIPGLSPADKEGIQKFTEESGLQGKFTAVIQAESGRFNLNSILSSYAPSASPSPTASGSPQPASTPSAAPSFNPENARASLTRFLEGIWAEKSRSDPDFVAEYRDFRVSDFADSLIAWADRNYERRNSGVRDYMASKQAPFYSLSELRMIAPMDDRLYEVFAPSLTVMPTQGLNINTMGDSAIAAVFSKLTEDDRKELLKYRDGGEDEGHPFNTVEDFFKYLSEKSAGYGGEKGVESLKKELSENGISLTVEETLFKITVTATAGQAKKILEAWVILSPPKTGSGGSQSSSSSAGALPPGAPPPLAGPGPLNREESGIRVTFMRIL